MKITKQGAAHVGLNFLWTTHRRTVWTVACHECWNKSLVRACHSCGSPSMACRLTGDEGLFWVWIYTSSQDDCKVLGKKTKQGLRRFQRPYVAYRRHGHNCNTETFLLRNSSRHKPTKPRPLRDTGGACLPQGTDERLNQRWAWFRDNRSVALWTEGLLLRRWDGDITAHTTLTTPGAGARYVKRLWPNRVVRFQTWTSNLAKMMHICSTNYTPDNM